MLLGKAKSTRMMDEIFRETVIGSKRDIFTHICTKLGTLVYQQFF